VLGSCRTSAVPHVSLRRFVAYARGERAHLLLLRAVGIIGKAALEPAGAIYHGRESSTEKETSASASASAIDLEKSNANDLFVERICWLACALTLARPQTRLKALDEVMDRVEEDSKYVCEEMFARRSSPRMARQ